MLKLKVGDIYQVLYKNSYTLFTNQVLRLTAGGLHIKQLSFENAPGASGVYKMFGPGNQHETEVMIKPGDKVRILTPEQGALLALGGVVPWDT